MWSYLEAVFEIRRSPSKQRLHWSRPTVSLLYSSFASLLFLATACGAAVAWSRGALHLTVFPKCSSDCGRPCLIANIHKSYVLAGKIKENYITNVHTEKTNADKYIGRRQMFVGLFKTIFTFCFVPKFFC